MVNVKTEICHNIFRSASSLMAFENFLRNVPQRTMHQTASAFGSTGAASPDAAGFNRGWSTRAPSQRPRQRGGSGG
jgi:preprotein translocase subunit SecA